MRRIMMFAVVVAVCFVGMLESDGMHVDLNESVGMLGLSARIHISVEMSAEPNPHRADRSPGILCVAPGDSIRVEP